MYQLRFIINKNDFEVIDTYPSYPIAFGMKKKKAAMQPETFPFDKLKIAKV